MANTQLARRFWTGLDDEHLATIGYVNFAWNTLQRKFCSLIWITANWNQEIGEVVTADLNNTSLVTLFLNLLKQELSASIDDRILEQGKIIVDVYDVLRSHRNHMVHCFFNKDPTKNIGQHIKITARKRRGPVEIQTVVLSKQDLEVTCATIRDCFDSIDDLIHKIYFRRKFLNGERGTFAQNYDQAVHGWRAPPCDVGALKEYLRVQRASKPVY